MGVVITLCGEARVVTPGVPTPQVIAPSNPTAVIPAVGQMRGPRGIQGNPGSGLNIKGSVGASAELPMAGNSSGDAYLVGLSLWVWAVESNTWIDLGEVKGPKGDPGAAGVTYLQDSPPASGLLNETWYNPLTFQLKVFTASGWQPVSPDGGYF